MTQENADCSDPGLWRQQVWSNGERHVVKRKVPMQIPLNSWSVSRKTTVFAPFWLKPFLFKRYIAHACTELLCLLRPKVTRIVMVRRGWSAIPAPAGWHEVIRGLRLPSVQWSSQPPKEKGKGKMEEGQERSQRRWQQPQARIATVVSRPPDLDTYAGQKEASLTAASRSLGQ